MTWKNWKFITPKGTPFKVEGEEMMFYPVSVGRALVLKDILLPICEAITTIFQGMETKGTQSQLDELITNQKTGESVNRVKIESISPEILKLRSEQQQRSMKNAVSVVFDPQNSLIVVRLIMDSLRDEFDRGIAEEKKMELAKELLETIDINHFKQLIQGLFEANKKVFGPFVTVIEQTKDMVAQKLGQFQETATQTTG